MSNKLSQSTKDAHQQLHQVMLIFKPDTVLCWHRELVRRKWIFRRKGTPGRPKVTSELEALIVRLAKKTLAGGTTRSRENCSSLATGCATSVRNILKRHRIIPASDRSSGSWRSFLGHYKDQILVCDFFKVETIWLKTIYVLFFIELGTRRIHMTGCTTNPEATWVTQQARQLVWELKDDSRGMTFFIHDNDTKLTSAFDSVFSTEGMKFYTLLIKLQEQMLSLKGGWDQFVKSVLTTSLWQVKTISEMYSERTRIITTIHTHTKALASTFLFQAQWGVQKVWFDGKIFWEVSSTIIPGHLKSRFLIVKRIFAQYRVQPCRSSRWFYISFLESSVSSPDWPTDATPTNNPHRWIHLPDQ